MPAVVPENSVYKIQAIKLIYKKNIVKDLSQVTWGEGMKNVQYKRI